MQAFRQRHKLNCNLTSPDSLVSRRVTSATFKASALLNRVCLSADLRACTSTMITYEDQHLFEKERSQCVISLLPTRESLRKTLTKNDPVLRPQSIGLGLTSAISPIATIYRMGDGGALRQRVAQRLERRFLRRLFRLAYGRSGGEVPGHARGPGVSVETINSCSTNSASR
jgi:hypothetical protein